MKATRRKKNAIKVTYSLFWENIIKKGKLFTKFAKVAPAPINIKKLGIAQQINVDVDKNKDRIVAGNFKNSLIIIKLLFRVIQHLYQKQSDHCQQSGF